jgi:lysophospholipase
MTSDIFFELAQNPTPENAQGAYFEGRAGKRIRFALFGATARPHKGTVLLLSGRNEFIEKYFETIGDLQKRGFDVAIKDWRGQGRSDRLLRNRERGYVVSFWDYVADLEQFFQDHVLPDRRGPYYILAHSTGGLIALLAAPAMANRIRRMVLSAPLLSIRGFPISMRTISHLTRTLRMIGLGRLFATGGRRPLVSFAANRLTSDLRRFERNIALVETFPELGMGGPTVAWVSRVCEAIDTVSEPDFMAKIHIPILFVAAGADEVVSTPAIEAFARGLRSGSIVTIDGARHEILQEADRYREQLLAAFDAFVPGSDPVYSQLTP